MLCGRRFDHLVTAAGSAMTSEAGCCFTAGTFSASVAGCPENNPREKCIIRELRREAKISFAHGLDSGDLDLAAKQLDNWSSVRSGR